MSVFQLDNCFPDEYGKKLLKYILRYNINSWMFIYVPLENKREFQLVKLNTLKSNVQRLFVKVVSSKLIIHFVLKV